MKKELELYASGTLKLKDWEEASSFWSEIANPDDTINSNYGFLTIHERDAPGVWGKADAYITQWEWAKISLTSDPNTRQAVMHFNKPRHQWFNNKDFPCTMHSIFRLRNNKLRYTVVMRSCDVMLGFPYDCPYFMWQQTEMAKQLSVGVGSFTLIAHSLHMYERDVKKLERML